MSIIVVGLFYLCNNQIKWDFPSYNSTVRWESKSSLQPVTFEGYLNPGKGFYIILSEVACVKINMHSMLGRVTVGTNPV